MSKLNKIILGLVIVIMLLISTIVYVLVSNTNKHFDSDPINPPIASITVVPPVGNTTIVDEADVKAAANKIVDRVWGISYIDLAEQDLIVLPKSGVSFINLSVDSEVTLAAVTAMSYDQNPYLGGSEQEAIQMQPDGNTANMKLYKQEYTDLKFFGYSNDTSRYLIKGYCNGEYFESKVNIMDFSSR